MYPLILHPTPEAQWQALVDEAEHSLSLHLSEELESYLVFLLMRFAKNPSVLNSILATDFLLTLEQSKVERHMQSERLKDVGDKCLLFAGLFPGRAERARVRLSYFVTLGQTAYGSLSKMSSSDSSMLFSDLHHNFIELMDILHSMQTLKNDRKILDLIQAEELWYDTHSRHALKILKENTGPNSLLGIYPPSNQKH